MDAAMLASPAYGLASPYSSLASKERRLIDRLAGVLIAAFIAVAPALAQTMDSPLPLKPGDAFGEEVTLPEQKILYFHGHGNWDTAFETLTDAFASLTDYAEPKGIKPSGNPMTIYMQTSDAGFEFLAALPIAEVPQDPPKGDIAVGMRPSGRMLKFTHRGSYESLDTTYEAVTNYLDEKQIDAKDAFIESYVSGPLKAGNNDMTVEIYVPIK
jgi:effector-binding domain-containing protein